MRSVKILLPGRAKPRLNWCKSDWNDGHKNTLQVPLTTIFPAGRSILLRQSQPRSPSESMPWWLTSCNKFSCGKHSLFYWGPVRKISPSWNWSPVRKSLPTFGATAGGQRGESPLWKVKCKDWGLFSLYSVLVFFWFSVDYCFSSIFWCCRVRIVKLSTSHFSSFFLSVG